MEWLKSKLCCFLLLATLITGAAHAGVAETLGFQISFDSQFTSTSAGVSIGTRVQGSFSIDAVDGETGTFRGSGRLRYVQLTGLPATPTDGVLQIFDLQISPIDGTVTVNLFPGDPKPKEWLEMTAFFQWFSAYHSMHMDEFGQSGYAIEDWEYPAGDPVFARKTYDRNRLFESVLITELTVIELMPLTELPRIDEINVESLGMSAESPETGKEVKLSANLFVPDPFEVQSCTWTGNNFTGAGEGDTQNNCEWTYQPEADDGPKPETYGDKNLRLMVVYSFAAQQSAFAQSSAEEYQVYFARDGDDDTNKRPNWFDYWGDNNAVPGLSATDVDYDASQTSIAYASGGKVFMGPAAALSDGSINIPATENCPGGTFPGGMGIDLAALTLAHERKHIELASLGGPDMDNDGVPDSAEAGTSPDDPDSCNLAGAIHADYATYGDDEFIARMAELGVIGVPDNDWALPGRMASMGATAASTNPPSAASGWSTIEPSGMQFSPQIHFSPQGLGGILTGTVGSAGVDTDGDLLNNKLLLNVEVNVASANSYSILGWLANDDGENIVWARTDVDLSPGTHQVQLEFDGVMLNRAGVTMPFEVSLVEFYARVGKHQVLQDSAENVHTTTLDSSDFDPPGAVLEGVVAEVPVDQDMDGLYDRLDVTVDITVNDPGTYEVSASLKGASMSLPAVESIASAEADSALAKPPASEVTVASPVVLSFDGASIFYHRADGPYQVANLKLIDPADAGELGFEPNAWTTSGYSHTDFQQSGIAIQQESYTDMAGEPDEEGKFSTLEIMFNLDSTVPGPYEVSAQLEDEFGKKISGAGVKVNLGGVEGLIETTMVQLSFAGVEISSSGTDGPYRLAGVTVISDTGIVFDQNPSPYLSSPYAADDFSSAIANPEIIFVDGFE
jgi:hypothetical protein